MFLPVFPRNVSCSLYDSCFKESSCSWEEYYYILSDNEGKYFNVYAWLRVGGMIKKYNYDDPTYVYFDLETFPKEGNVVFEDNELTVHLMVKRMVYTSLMKMPRWMVTCFVFQS